MTVTLLVVAAGLAVIGCFGVLGRHRQRELSGWTVGGRKLGGGTMWFLQAGEMFTIFTFLGLAGLGFSGGVAALYALLYIPIAFVGMVIAFAITVGFVVWSGIRGIATASYLKDGLLLIVLVVLAAVIPSHFAGGLGALFTKLVHQHPAILTIHSGPNDSAWFASGVAASALGILCMTLPHMWPELLAARSARALRRNYVFLPAYCLVLVFPVFIGMTAIGVLPGTADSNSALPRLVSQSLPPWLVGLVVVGVAATAMVPAGGIIIGMSTLVSRNIVRSTNPKAQFRVTIVSVFVVAGLALVLALLRPDLIANLLLLTYSGLDQLVPAILLALFARGAVGRRPVLVGMLVGVATVIALTPPFGYPHVGHVNAGLLALGPNLLVVAVGVLVKRRGTPKDERIPASENEAVMQR
jgi:solute:Na+ symporter, SSS family